MTIVVSLILTIEVVLFSLAGFTWLRSRGYTFAEAGAAGILLVFMVFSLIHQIDLFTGSPLPGLILESVSLAAVLTIGLRRLSGIPRHFVSMVHLLRHETFPGVIVLAAWTVMAGLVAVEWSSPAHFPVVHPFSDATVIPSGSFSLIEASGPIVPLNAVGLFYHTARFGLAPNACGFGLLAYMAVGFSTYALARRYAWPPMALTITLMVLSMPRLVALALVPSAELIATAAVAVSLVLLYRLVEQHTVWDLRFFVLCLLFSIHAHPMSVALVLVMALLLTIIMLRRHGWLLMRELLAAHPALTVVILAVAAVMSQVPVFALNMAHGNPPFGEAVLFDTDGIIGAAANVIRYVFISIDPTEPVHGALAWLIGMDLNRLLMVMYEAVVVSLFGQAGAVAPFAPVFSGGGTAGFGPFALFLIVPAMVYAAVRGPRRLKAVSIAWAGYLYLAALVVAWTPENLAVLSPLYAANGFVVAFSLPPWRLRRRGMRILQTLFAALLAAALLWGGSWSLYG